MNGRSGSRPEPSAPRPYEFPGTVRHTLDNGLQVVVASVPRLPLVSVFALVTAGDSEDLSGMEGIASLTVTAMAEGTTHRDGAALTESFELLGTSLRTESDWDEAIVGVTVTPGRLALAMSLLGEVLTAPAFAEGEVERLKAERLAELLQQQVEPRSLADDKFTEFLYDADSRYGKRRAGNTETVRRLNSGSVRDFHRRRYVPPSTTLILAGDVTAELAIQLAERSLGRWSGAMSIEAEVDDNVRTDTDRINIVHKAHAPQTELRVGHRGVSRAHPDYFPIVVMNAILGGLFSSRINLNLRERHAYTYGAHSLFDWRRKAGPFVVSTAVKSEVTEAATREILSEINQLRSETVGAEELSLAVDYLDGVFPLRYETTATVADAIARAVVYDLGDDYYSRYRERIRAVTADDVRRAAEMHLHPDQLTILAVGDAEVISGPLAGTWTGRPRIHEADVEP